MFIYTFSGFLCSQRPIKTKILQPAKECVCVCVCPSGLSEALEPTQPVLLQEPVLSVPPVLYFRSLRQERPTKGHGSVVTAWAFYLPFPNLGSSYGQDSSIHTLYKRRRGCRHAYGGSPRSALCVPKCRDKCGMKDRESVFPFIPFQGCWGTSGQQPSHKISFVSCVCPAALMGKMK